MAQKVMELDVREDLNNKIEPFQKIMETIKDAQANDIFVLHAPFTPIPLYAVLKGKGFTYEEEQVEKKHWKITFTKIS
ncbi:DUF2249 domain-containing protein [Neobacillus sp. Marseille-QA0830]